MIQEQFPSSFDVEQTLTFYTTPYDSLKQFTQGLGIFVAGKGKQDIADFASNILFEHQQYIRFRKMAQGAEVATTISGFTIRNKLYELSKEMLIQDFVSLKQKIDNNRKELIRKGAPIPKLSSPIEINETAIELKFEYERLIPGRVELMQRVNSKIELSLHAISPTQWRIVCYPQANQDVKEVEKLFSKMPSYETYTISLDYFPQEKRIQFFDNLIQYYTRTQEWSVEQVTEITIQSSRVSNEERMILEEEDAELVEANTTEVDRKDLRSINQAILQGQYLRTNSFVKDCEKQGFYFLSMTLELSNTKSSEVIQVRIRFKLSPKMFELVLVSMAERNEMGEVTVTFPENRQQEILREFWTTTHEIWHQLDKDIVKPPKEQSSFSDYLESQGIELINQ